MNYLPMTEDERMAAFRNDRPIHLLKHVKCWGVAPQHEQRSKWQVQEALPERVLTTPTGYPPSDTRMEMEM